MRAEINENRITIEKTSKVRSWFLEKTNKILKLPAKLTKEASKKERKKKKKKKKKRHKLPISGMTQGISLQTV